MGKCRSRESITGGNGYGADHEAQSPKRNPVSSALISEAVKAQITVTACRKAIMN